MANAELAVILSARDGASKALLSFGKNLGQLEGASKKAGQSVGLMGGVIQTALGVVGGTLITGAVSGILGVGKGALAAGINFNTLKEQATIAFTTMLGSGEKAQSFLSQLQSFAASTPFEFPDLITASQRLVAMGFSADRVIPIMTSVGNAVAGLGSGQQGIDRVTTALGQMQAKGKVSSEEMMQLTEAGIPAWKYLAEAIGVDIPTAMKLVTAGAVDADKGISAVLKGMDGDFAGMMVGQSKTWAGMWSNLKDLAVQGLGQITKPMFDLGTKAMTALVGAMTTPAFQAGITRITAGLTQVTNALAGLATKYGPAVLGFLQRLGGLLGDIGGRYLSGVRAAFDAISAFASGKINLSQLIGGFQILYSTVVKQLGDAAARVAGFFLGIGTKIAGFLTSAIPAVLTAVAQIFAGVVNAITGQGGPQVEGAMGKAMPGAFTKWVQPMIGPFLAAVGTLYTTLATFIAASAPGILAQLGSWGRAFVGWVETTAIPFIVPKLQAFLAMIGSWITGTALPWIGQQMLALGQAFGNWVTTTAIPYLQTNLPLWLAALGTWITGTALPWIGEQMGKLGEAFGTWVTETAIPFLQANLPVWLVALGNWILGTAVPWIKAQTLAFGVAFGTWITETAIPYLQENLPRWLDALGTWITGTAVPAVVAGLKLLGKEFGEWVENAAVPYLREKLPLWRDAITDWITGTAIPAIVAGLLKVGEAFGDWITEKAVPYLQEKIPQWLSAIGTFLTGTALPAIRGKAQELGEGLVEYFMTEAGKLIGKVKAKMGEVPGAITEGLGDLSKLLFQKGKDLVQGFIDGIDSLIGTARAKASELAGVASTGVAKTLQEKSPSRVMMAIGRDFVQGFIDGMDEKQGEAAAKAASVASAVAKAAEDVLGAIGAVANFDFAANSPTGETLGWFRHMAESLILTLRDIATLVGTDALDAAKQVGESMGQVGSAVKSTLEGFKALAEYDFAANSPNGDMMGWFTHLMQSIVLNFAGAAQLVGTEGMTQATAFAKAVSDVVAAGKGALEMFTQLIEFKDKPTEALTAIWESLEEALSKAHDIFLRGDAIKEEMAYFANAMKDALRYMNEGLSIGNGMSGAMVTVPAGVGGGAGAGAGGSTTTNNFSVTVPGNIYGMDEFEDVVVGTLQKATSRGRL